MPADLPDPYPESILRTLEALYGSVLEPTRRAEVSQQMGQATGAHLTAFWCLRCDHGQVNIHSHGHDTAIDTYLGDWAGHDGVIHGVLTDFLGQTVDMDMLGAESVDLRRDSAFEGFYEPYDLVNAAGRFNTVAPGWIGGIAVLRGRHQGRFGRADMAALEALGPHIERSLRLSLQLETLETRNAAADGVLHGTCLVAVACTPSGWVLDANLAGERALRGPELGLGIQANRIVHEDPATHERLHAALRQVEQGSAVPREFRLPAAGSAAAWCTVLPLPFEGGTRCLGSGNALVLVETPAERRAVPPDRLKRPLGISPAESEVLAAFMRGEDPVTVAKARGCTHETVRSCEKSLRVKLGCKNRAALVARAWQTIAAIPGAGAAP